MQQTWCKDLETTFHKHRIKDNEGRLEIEAPLLEIQLQHDKITKLQCQQPLYYQQNLQIGHHWQPLR